MFLSTYCFIFKCNILYSINENNISFQKKKGNFLERIFGKVVKYQQAIDTFTKKKKKEEFHAISLNVSNFMLLTFSDFTNNYKLCYMKDDFSFIGKLICIVESSRHNSQFTLDCNVKDRSGRKKNVAKSQLTLANVTKNTPT